MSPATNIDLSKVVFPDPMTVWEASIYTGSSDMRIRTLIRKGTLKAAKSDRGTVITKAALAELKANPPRRGGGGGVRKDGKAFVIHVKAEQLQAVQDFLKSKGIELELKNKPSKPKVRGANTLGTQAVAGMPVPFKKK